MAESSTISGRKASADGTWAQGTAESPPGSLYRPGEAVAVVVSLTADGAIARPLSDPGQTEFVAVEPLFDEIAQPVAAPRAALAGKR